MNFSTIKGLTIPEGMVVQITDERGNVLWAKKTLNGVLLTSSDNYVLKDNSGLYLTAKEAE